MNVIDRRQAGRQAGTADVSFPVGLIKQTAGAGLELEHCTARRLTTVDEWKDRDTGDYMYNSLYRGILTAVEKRQDKCRQ